MKASREFLFVIAVLCLVALALLWFLRSMSPEHTSSRATEDIDRTISEKETELQALIERSPEEEARNAALRKTLSATSTTEDVPPPGVRIETTPKGKVVINESEGYRITLPQRLVLARSVESDHLEFHDSSTMCQGDPSCPPVLHIDVAGGAGGLSLEEWFLSGEAEAGEPIYSPRESLVINGVRAARVSATLPEIFDGYDYYFAHNRKIYVLQIARVYHDAYKEVIYSLMVEIQ